MFFTNLMIYRITQEMEFDIEALEAALATKPAREPVSQELSTYGFVAPFGKGEHAPLVHDSYGFQLIATRQVEKIMPGNVIRDDLRARVEKIEADQGRKVYRKERDQLKDELIQEMLPKAFPRRKATFAAIDRKAGLIIVNTASPRTAEDLLSTLREVLGTLPVRPITVKLAPVATLTDWLTTKKPADDFFVLDECTLADTHEDGGTANLKRQDLTGEETQMHLTTGKVATKVSLAWQDKLTFVVDDKLGIKRLKFADLLQDQAESDGGDDALGQLDAAFVLMMLTFREFLPVLFEAFGGEEIPKGLGEDFAPTFIPKAKREHRAEVQLDAFHSVDGKQVASSELAEFDEEDALFAEAVNFVRESGRASISAVQRKLKIGYNRAARLIEKMEDTGVVTAMNSNGSREVIK